MMSQPRPPFFGSWKQPKPTMLTSMLLITATLACFAARAQATSPAVQAAFETLMKGQPINRPAILAQATSPRSAPGLPIATTTSVAPAGAMVVQPGQTLDRIIRTQIPNSPFKNDLVRRAVMDLNPAAFPLGSPHLIRAGSVLTIPTAEQIRQSVVQHNPTMLPYVLGSEGKTGSVSARSRDQSQWVRFP